MVPFATGVLNRKYANLVKGKERAKNNSGGMTRRSLTFCGR